MARNTMGSCYTSLATRINSFVVGESSECLSLLVEELWASFRDGDISDIGYEHLRSMLDGFLPCA